MATRTETKGFELLYARALMAGRFAAIEATKGMATYAIMEGERRVGTMTGLCGFAWVNVKDRKFGNYLKKMGLGRADHYYGGVTVWISDYNQSHEMKTAHAYAMAKVFKEAGVDAYAAERLD